MPHRKTANKTPPRPKRRRARRAIPAALAVEAQGELGEPGLDAAHQFIVRRAMPFACAMMARRRGTPDVSPKDYYCCGEFSPRRFLPVCLGDRENCPVAKRFPDAASEAPPPDDRRLRTLAGSAARFRDAKRLKRLRQDCRQ
ncbi:MAG: hypothetical protein AAGD92_13940 [Pseudomonadota bacterium]